jgi:hypothetical protein
MRNELTGERDLTYSAWHRQRSTRRFVGIDRAQSLGMIDIDGVLFVEYDTETREPLALIETACYVGQRRKPATVTAALARRAGIPAFTVLYEAANDPNPADSRFPDIARFHVKRLWPQPERSWRIVEPEQWAKALLHIRHWMATLGDLPDRFDLELFGETTTRLLLFHKHLRHASIVRLQGV